MTVSSQLILDQPIFHCGSIAKSLLYSSELSRRYCVCAHSLERNPILRSNSQLSSQRELSFFTQPTLTEVVEGDFTALPSPSAGSTRGENGPKHSSGH